MSDYRESSNHAKAVRAGIVDARPVSGKSKRPTPVKLYVFMRWLRSRPGEWQKYGEYRDESAAMMAARNYARKYSFMLRFRFGKDGAEFDPRITQEPT